jgi:hypothetical protein
MVKDAAISIRVEPSLKERLEQTAAEAGMTLAAYAERALDTHSAPPQWELKDPEVVHTARLGTAVKINIAAGWPVCLLDPQSAEKLGYDLLECARASKRLKPIDYDVYLNKKNTRLIVPRGSVLPRRFAIDKDWTLAAPPRGVAPDIALDVEKQGYCLLNSNLPYRKGDLIGYG